MKTQRKVLVVDDDPVIARSFDRVLSGKGYAVINARDGEEALRKLKDEKYDVVFTDIRMPGMSGIEVAERVKASQPWLPVVIVTGYGTEENQARARAAGVSGFLHKPLSPMRPLARSGDVDNRVTDHLDKFFEKGARPAGVFKTKLKLSDPDYERIRRRLEQQYGGALNWHKTMVLDSDAEYQRTGMTFEEMNFETLDDRNEARICAVLDVPPIIVGARVGLNRSTFANYQEARSSWWEDKLVPLYRKLSDGIDLQLTPEFGDDVETAWDYNQVPALQDRRNAQWQRATSAFQTGAISLNQFYREVGLEEVEGGDDLRARSLVRTGDAPDPVPQSGEDMDSREEETPPADDEQGDEMDDEEMMDDAA